MKRTCYQYRRITITIAIAITITIFVMMLPRRLTKPRHRFATRSHAFIYILCRRRRRP
jgi:hypothetical protein